MKSWSGTATALSLLLLSACSGSTPAPEPLPSPPAITAFQAAKPRITAGESVELTWTAENATEVDLVDQNGEKIEFTGDASAGSARVTPAASSFFVLRVQGEGGRDNAFVQVAVDEPLKEVSLVAVPPQIDAGETAQLIWTAFGAKAATLQFGSGDVLQLNPSKGADVVELTPGRTTSYTLVGTGAADQQFTATTEIKVRPVLSAFEALPGAARAGEKITFTWKTAGAAQVVLSETTFGTLTTVTDPAQVGDGTFEWAIPATYENGDAVADGQPLRFTLTVTQSNPEVTLTRTIDSLVGEGPRIVEFNAPAAVSAGKLVHLSWRTLNANRLQVLVNGALVYEPLARDQDDVARGGVALAAPAQDSTYELIAYGNEQTKTILQKTVRVRGAPAVDEFNLTAVVAQPGASANAQWKTSNADQVTLRVKNGPVVFSSQVANAVAQGTTSLFPGLRTTFVLEAWNEAGDVATAEKTVEVSAPATLTSAPAVTTPGQSVTFNWSLGAATAQVAGYPDLAGQKVPGSLNFYDLMNVPAASELAFGDTNDDVTALNLLIPFRFPFLGRTIEDFYVSTNGFIAFEKTDARAQNDDPTANKPLPMMLAPFWDDLSLGENSQVLYLVEGSSFPRRLVIQWNQVQTASRGELTFQAQLLENGEFRFIYKGLNGADSAGESATIGWRYNADHSEKVSQNAAFLTSDDEISFFSSLLVTGQSELPIQSNGAFTLFGKSGTGTWVVYPAQTNVILPGTVVLNEMMVLGDMSTTAGKWIEVANLSDRPVDISGTELAVTSSQTRWTLPAGAVVPANGFLVLGESNDKNANGGVQVDYAWTDLTNGVMGGDTVELWAGNPISSITWKAADVVPGTSILRPAREIGTDGKPLPCPRTANFGPNAAVGSPGAANETCFEYTLSQITEDFDDISISGSARLQYGADLDNRWVWLDLDGATFPYFGTPQSKVTLSTNGWVAFQHGMTSSHNVNKTKPATDTAPFGTLAVFWDDLSSRTGSTSANVFAERRRASGTRPGHWIFQWEDWTRYRTAADAALQDRLRFQAKLFDDGVIEYHYDTMTVVDPAKSYATGKEATIWIERPTGDAALAVGINQSVISPHTAYRFTPKP